MCSTSELKDAGRGRSATSGWRFEVGRPGGTEKGRGYLFLLLCLRFKYARMEQIVMLRNDLSEGGIMV